MPAAAALLMLAEVSADAKASSLAAARLYEQACVEGQFRLDRKRGELVEAARIPADVRGATLWNVKVDQGRYIRMTDPPRTYLQLISYANPRSGAVESECTLSSQVLQFDDAADVFNKNAEKAAVYRRFGDTKWWSISVPEHGYSKSMTKGARGWIIIQTFTYHKPN